MANETQQAAEAEDDLGEAAGVGGMLLDLQAGFVKQKTVQDVRRLMRRGSNHLGVEGAELIGEVAVEADPGFVAVAGVELGAGGAVAAGWKNWPSDDDIWPPPHDDAKGSWRCASTSRAVAWM